MGYSSCFKSLNCRWGFQHGTSGKEPTCHAGDKRCQSDPWVGKIPWRKAWQYSSILVWRILWTEEPGRLQSPRSHSRARLKCLSTPAQTVDILLRNVELLLVLNKVLINFVMISERIQTLVFFYSWNFKS